MTVIVNIMTNYAISKSTHCSYSWVFARELVPGLAGDLEHPTASFLSLEKVTGVEIVVTDGIWKCWETSVMWSWRHWWHTWRIVTWIVVVETLLETMEMTRRNLIGREWSSFWHSFDHSWHYFPWLQLPWPLDWVAISVFYRFSRTIMRSCTLQ